MHMHRIGRLSTGEPGLERRRASQRANGATPALDRRKCPKSTVPLLSMTVPTAGRAPFAGRRERSREGVTHNQVVSGLACSSPLGGHGEVAEFDDFVGVGRYFAVEIRPLAPPMAVPASPRLDQLLVDVAPGEAHTALDCINAKIGGQRK
jgi:hypothetical protein